MFADASEVEGARPRPDADLAEPTQAGGSQPAPPMPWEELANSALPIIDGLGVAKITTATEARLQSESLEPTKSSVTQVAVGTSQAEIQRLIDTAPSGATIQLAAGTFTFNETLLIARSDITFRGAGSDRTTIVSSIDDPASTILVRSLDPRSTIGTLTATATADSTTLTLSSVSGIRVGDVVYVVQPNDDAFLAATGNTGWEADPDADPENVALREMIVEVTAIRGNTLTLSHPLPYTFESGKAYVRKQPMLENVTLSGFTIATPGRDPDPLSFENTRDGWDSIPTLSIDSARDARLTDIVIENAVSHGFEFQRVFEISGDELTVQGARNKGAGGNGYAFYFNEAFATDFTDLEAFDTRHAVLTSAGSAEHYNTINVRDTNRDINFHGSPDADNVVTVERMVMDYVAGGTQWIAVGPGSFPLHPRSTIEANTVTFVELRASDLADDVTAAAIGGDLDGALGGDRLRGAGGADTLTGGGGNDTLSGGAGTDRFVRTFGAGSDTVLDFDAGARGDRLVLEGYAVDSFAELMITQSGADAIVNLGQDGTVRLAGVQATALIAGNFEFVAVGDARPDLIAQGGAPLVMGGDGDDVIAIGNAQIVAATPVIGGDGEDVVTPLVVNFLSSTSTWGAWSGVDVLDFTDATSVALTIDDDAILRQADDAELVLRYGPTTAVSVNVGVPTGGSALLLEGSVSVQLASGRPQRVGVSDAVGGRVIGGSNADTIYGGALGDSLTGGAGNDRLEGRGGRDTLTGGLGQDTLVGGFGADRFVFNALGDSLPGRSTRDEITDFSISSGDVIDLSAIDAKVGGGDDAFTLSLLFTGVAGQLIQVRTLTSTLIQGDVDGDAVADFSVSVKPGLLLTADDFVL